MRRARHAFPLALLLSMLCGLAAGDTLRVPQDFPTIQAALNASAQGDVVLVSKGTYAEGLVLTNLPGRTLMAKGKVVVDTGNGIDAPIVITNCDGLAVKGLRFRTVTLDAVIVSGSDDVVLDGVRATAGGVGIRIVDGEGIHLRNCRVEIADQQGIVVGGALNFVDRCRVTGAGTQGILIEGERCTVADSRVNGAGGEGIVVEGADCLVEGNRVRDTLGSGIAALPGPRALLRGNRVNDSSFTGITLTGGSVRVEGNRITNVGSDGVRVIGDDAAIVENRIVKPALDGVAIASGADRCIVDGNVTISAGAFGYDIDGDETFASRNVAKKPQDGFNSISGVDNVYFAPAPFTTGPVTKRVPQDFPTIQAALDAAVAFDVIQVAAGTYTESLLIDNATGIALVGKGKVVIDGGVNANVVHIEDSLSVFLVGLELRNSADGVSIAGTADVVVLSKVTIRDCIGAGIQSAAAGVILDRVRVYDTGSTGMIVNGEAVVVDRCTITRPGFEGLRLAGNRVVGARNKIVDADQTGLVVGDLAVGAVVSRNTIVRAGSSGIVAPLGGVGVLITNNRVKDAEAHGLVIESDDAILAGNRVQGAAGDGIRFDAAGARGFANVISGCGSVAYHLLDMVTGAYHHENRGTKCGTGLFLQIGADGCLITRNKATKSSGVDFGTFEPLASNVFLENVFPKTGP